MAITVIFSINSCTKQDHQSDLTGEFQVSNNLLESVKGFYSKETSQPGKLSILSNNNGSLLIPLWESGAVEILNSSKSVVLFDAPPGYLSPNSPLYAIRKIAFEVEDGSVTNGKIIEIYGNPDYIKANKDNIIEKYLKGEISDLNISVITYALNYKYIKSIRYENGVKIDATVKVMNKQNLAVKQKGVATKNSTTTSSYWCVDTYMVTTIGSYEYWDYLYTECQDLGGVNGENFGGTGDTGSGTSIDPAVYTITSNNVTDPCLSAWVTNFINNDLKFNLKESMNSIFNANDQINLNFFDANMGASIDGTAQLANYWNDGGEKYVVVNINLNNTTLPNSSAEYVASTIIHEALHAFFRYKGQLSSLDHDVMASQYISYFEAAMRDIFPNIDNVDNNHLAWGGLGETARWNALSSAQKTVIAATNRAFKAGTVGHPCN